MKKRFRKKLNNFKHVKRGKNKTKSPAVARGDALQPIAVSVAVLIINVIQNQLFFSHRKGRMLLPISDQ